jgi:hypothetical protein
VNTSIEAASFCSPILFDEVSIEKLSLSDRANSSRTIAMYETLGLYLRRDYLIEDDAIEMWEVPHTERGARASHLWSAELSELGFLRIRISVILQSATGVMEANQQAGRCMSSE